MSKYMRPRHGRPTQTWALFPREHAAEIAAIDLFSVQTVLFERLYAFIVLGHSRRRLPHIAVTDHPTAAWLALQITEAFPWDTASAILVRDNDGAFGLRFRKRLRAMGIRDRPTRPSPWQNGHVERLIGSIRREGLDHHLILNAAHQRRVPRAYADYYNRDRPHLALDNDAPEIRPVEGQEAIISTLILGGLHHRYGCKRSV